MKFEKTRRKFIKETATLGSGLLLTSCTTISNRHVSSDDNPDFIIVGSGAGGGPLAARLARRGFHVILLEAGRDHKDPQNNSLADIKQRVPAYQGISTEVDEWSWNFFVRQSGMHSSHKKLGHTFDDKKNSKFIKEKNGILYPRASALGGCSIHNAMITMISDPQDWEDIGNLTDDQSWNKKDMGQLFIDRIQNRRYGRGILSGNNRDDANFYKGSEGCWLSNERPSPRLVAFERNLRSRTLQSIQYSLLAGNKLLRDPNANPFSGRKEGAIFTPMATHNGQRISPREWLLDTEKFAKGKLEIRTGYFATKLIFSDRTKNGKQKVIGVEGLFDKEKRNLYSASPEFQNSTGDIAKKFGLKAKKEVILAGGAFNTPQLLMLSGIGPSVELSRHNISLRVNLPGVGRNLQDRYEISAVANFHRSTSSIANCTFNPNKDPCLKEYLDEDKKSKHIYSTNGVIVGHIKKSKSVGKNAAADLCIFATPGDFRGYRPGWSTDAVSNSKRLTWAIIKGHTRNTKGFVKLKNDNPLSTPEINFMNFAEGREADLDALMEGLQIARQFNKSLNSSTSKIFKEEVWPPALNPKTGLKYTMKELRNLVKTESWGHHASCSCKMGPSPENGDVVNSKFQVHGVEGLRIVDASVFPKIPGLFIAAPIYTIAEKAADELTSLYS